MKSNEVASPIRKGWLIYRDFVLWWDGMGRDGMDAVVDARHSHGVGQGQSNQTSPPTPTPKKEMSCLVIPALPPDEASTSVKPHLSSSWHRLWLKYFPEERTP
jgi:hypothetical protein